MVYLVKVKVALKYFGKIEKWIRRWKKNEG